ncbi:hypothetical protein C6V05_12025 [Burkholderia multivorans]|nr:hypothetical protein C6V05_12025 [Burkholderia multivorans]
MEESGPTGDARRALALCSAASRTTGTYAAGDRDRPLRRTRRARRSRHVAVRAASGNAQCGARSRGSLC